MTILERIRSPRDLDRLTPDELRILADDIRAFLVREVSRTGGHLGPNLGVVELTIAMHRVFRSPRDAFVFDTGHQSYVHKLLTGRQDFSRLRQRGGIAGYPQRSESEHDIVESSHASSSLSWADGISRAFDITGQHDRSVVAVVEPDDQLGRPDAGEPCDDALELAGRDLARTTAAVGVLRQAVLAHGHRA